MVRRESWREKKMIERNLKKKNDHNNNDDDDDHGDDSDDKDVAVIVGIHFWLTYR